MRGTPKPRQAALSLALAACLTLVTLAAVALGTSACARGDSSGPAEPIIIGMEPNGVNALVYIAESQGYFAAHGLDVTIREYPSGLAAVEGLLAGEVDVATAAEFVLVGKALAGSRITTVASINKFMHIYLIAAQARGIEDVQDLSGKRIGLSLGTAAEFYLGRFLELNGLSIDQMRLVDVQPPRVVEALAEGEVDAVITWQPIVCAIEERLGNDLMRWPAQSHQLAYDLALCNRDWAAAHPELAERLVAALVQAEEHTRGHPDQVQTTIQARMGYDDAYIAAIWPQYHLGVSLDHSLILALEDEARWMIEKDLTAEEQVPDFVNHVYVDALAAVNPQAVTIIR